MPFYVTDQEDVPRIFYSLWTGAEYGDEACVISHIEKRGVGVNATDGHGYTALHLAAQHNHVGIVKYLLGRGALVDSGLCTPLHRAAYSGSLASCKLLLDAGANVGSADRSFGDLRTPLHKAAARHVDVVLLLIDAGADLEALDKQGQTPLHVAAESGDLDCIDLLLERGADSMAKDKNGRCPADVAAMNGHEEAMQALALDPLKQESLSLMPLKDILHEEPKNEVVKDKSPVVVVTTKKQSSRRIAAACLPSNQFEKAAAEAPPRIVLDDEGAAVASSLFRSLRASDKRRRQAANIAT